MIRLGKMDGHYFIMHGGLHGLHLFHFLLHVYPMGEQLKNLLLEYYLFRH